MIILINGSFGVGKSTVAEILQDKLPNSRIYDPEVAGSILMRLPSWIKLRGAGTGDFQNIDLWRKSVSFGIRLSRTINRGPIIVPMAFDRHDYLNEISQAIRRFDPDLRLFCLRASLPTIHERLRQRGALADSGSEWVLRRSAECTLAHADPAFGLPIDTDNASAEQVADTLLKQLS
ncbi:MAG: AAA family ATPase [Caldilineaceae bacterium]